jgi:hypothetical protein
MVKRGGLKNVLNLEAEDDLETEPTEMTRKRSPSP